MAFSFSCTLHDLEYRALRSGVSKTTGNEWWTLVFEDAAAGQLEITVPAELRGEVAALGLKKGDTCMVTIRAIAMSNGNSYLRLLDAPMRDSDYDTDF